jgi:spermidine synthase
MQPASSYDLVTLEPPPINFAGVAGLFSREFYELARSRLKEGGYLTQWLPGYQVSEQSNLAIVRAFVDVFPGAVLVSGQNRDLILMGMKGGKAILDVARVRRSLAKEPAVRRDLATIGVHSVADLAGTFAASYETLRSATAQTAPVTDDDPIIEYDTLITPVFDNRMPAEMFDVGDLRSWCPDCYRGDRLRVGFRRLEYLQRALSVYYASDAFLHFSNVPGRSAPPRELKKLVSSDPCVASVLREDTYYRWFFGNVLQGVPERPCEH